MEGWYVDNAIFKLIHMGLCSRRSIRGATSRQSELQWRDFPWQLRHIWDFRVSERVVCRVQSV